MKNNNLTVSELIKYLNRHIELYGDGPVYFMGEDTAYKDVPIKTVISHMTKGVEDGIQLWDF